MLIYFVIFIYILLFIIYSYLFIFVCIHDWYFLYNYLLYMQCVNVCLLLCVVGILGSQYCLHPVVYETYAATYETSESTQNMNCQCAASNQLDPAKEPIAA